MSGHVTQWKYWQNSDIGAILPKQNITKCEAYLQNLIEKSQMRKIGMQLKCPALYESVQVVVCHVWIKSWCDTSLINFQQKAWHLVQQKEIGKYSEEADLRMPNLFVNDFNIARVVTPLVCVMQSFWRLLEGRNKKWRMPFFKVIPDAISFDSVYGSRRFSCSFFYLISRQHVTHGTAPAWQYWSNATK